MPMPSKRKRIVLDYPWPFPLMGTGGQLLQVVIKQPKKPRPKPLRKVPPPSRWEQQTLLP